VLEELETGDYLHKADCLSLVTGIPLLAVTSETLRIAEVYRIRLFIPRHPVADSVHVALASQYRLDYLLTWNCRHLANVHKVRHLEELNHAMHLHVPLPVTPHQLQPWEE
jgi:predicted nucleic acid-binding protein